MAQKSKEIFVCLCVLIIEEKLMCYLEIKKKNKLQLIMILKKDLLVDILRNVFFF